MRKKCVSGSASESSCAGRGIASQGNMNPERRMFGSKKKKLICIACCCVCASVEKKSPSARLAAMKTNASRYKSKSDPVNGTPNTQWPRSRISVICR